MAINRVGYEQFVIKSNQGENTIKTFGPCFGSTYLAAPNGVRTEVFISNIFTNFNNLMFHYKYFLQSLSNCQDGILFVEFDLNLCDQMKKLRWFQINQHLSNYSERIANAAESNFIPEIIS